MVSSLRFTAGLAAAMLLWPTITEHIHLTRNVHQNLSYECPTAKTGLLGEEEEDGDKGEFGAASSDSGLKGSA
ncbi:hypothetical protein JHK86_048131 [Glycine max]|nr:hypothetical protein JHK86_048131 [Glycine max]